MGDRGGFARAIGGAGLRLRGRRLSPAAGAALAAAALAAAAPAAQRLTGPELFLRPRGFFLGPDATITLPVFDGTFGASEHAVARARLIDLGA